MDTVSWYLFTWASRFLCWRLRRRDKVPVAGDFIAVPRGMKYKIIEKKATVTNDPLDAVDTIGVRFL